MRRRSSGVERALGKGEASGSIPLGGTNSSFLNYFWREMEEYQ